MTKKLHHKIVGDRYYDKAIKGEQDAQIEYEELAEEHPRHKRSIKEIQHDEKTHEAKLKRLKKVDEKRKKIPTNKSTAQKKARELKKKL